MSNLFFTTCTDCGWTGRHTSQAKADYAHRQHSCAKAHLDAAAHARGLARDAAVDRTPRPCLHKRANHQHGTYTAYTLDQCRCVPCAAAASIYNADLARRNAYGRSNLVDAGPIRAHIAALREAGIGLKRLTALGVASSGELTKLVYGVSRGDGTHRPPARRIHAETAQRILAVTATADSVAGGVRVNPIGTCRRLQGLIALGWSVQRLADTHSLDRQPLDAALTGCPVSARTARAVRAMFETVGDAHPPETNRGERYAASCSRRRAAAHHWAVPAMWDPEDLDDPYAESPTRVDLCTEDGCTRPGDAAKGLCWPHYQAGRHERITGSTHTLDLDEWAHLVRGGVNPDEAARRCGGAGWKTIETLAYRHERTDILSLLRDTRESAA